uniref:Fibronectin type-III domain-containing protein n=1 Tax=Ditylenchus dipsaci TaxID=166011 RepID=A0A915E7U3_9BILA
MLADQHHQQQTSLSSQQEPVVTIPVWPYGPGGGGGQSGQPMEPIPEEEDFASPTSSYSLRTDAQQSLSPGSVTANTTTISSLHRAQKSSPSPRDSSATTTTITTTKTSTGKPNSPITENSLASHQDTDLLPVRTVESKHRVKEIYTTEEVDTLVSTLPKKSVPEEWNQFSSQEVVVDPSMAHTYITELSGNGHPASARGSKYSYTYESHIDDEPLPTTASMQYISNGGHSSTSFSPDPQHSTTNGYTQAFHIYSKVTRVTKITTTRSVKQIPVNPDDIFFDADGNPIVNGYDAHQLAELEGEDGLGIDLSRTYISEHEEFSSPPSSSSAPPPPAQLSMGLQHRDYDMLATYSEVVPSAPGVPQVIDISPTNVSLAWLRPDRDGTGGEILGYRVQFRRDSDIEPWEPAHDDLLGETECKREKTESYEYLAFQHRRRRSFFDYHYGIATEDVIVEHDDWCKRKKISTITNLEPQDSYHFRVVAANSAGFGPPSESTNGGFAGADYSIPYTGRTNGDYLNVPAPPTRPIVVDIDGDRAIVEWRHIDVSSPSPDGLLRLIIGFIWSTRLLYSSWMPSNDRPVPGFRHQVQNLRPNGEYEFRVLAKDEEGRLSAPSLSSGIVRIRPAVPSRSQNIYNPALQPPGQPQAIDSDSNWIQLQWSPGAGDPQDEVDHHLSLPSIGYLLERREIGDPDWVILSPPHQDEPFLVDNQFIVENLHPDACYEFRVSTIALKDGSQSAPSDPSDVIRLRPPINYNTAGLNLKKCNSLLAACSKCASRFGLRSGIQGCDAGCNYVVQTNEQLVRSCKTTVGYLIHGHQYQFRILAKNSAGFSPPSDASPLITIGQPLVSSLKDTKYVEAERHATVALLQDEMVRESPPLPDRDDSLPSTIYRQPAGSHLQWRDPTLKEVIDYLKSPDQAVVQDASGYLQHLTYNNDAMKEETRNYGGIPNLIQLLKVPEQNPEILRNACGCLKNLAFGKDNDVNKKLINQSGGVKSLAIVIQRTQSAHVKEEATGALWNISSCDDLKEPILNQVTEPIINGVVIPFSGLFSNQIQEPSSSKNSNVFRNGTGILRNISAISANARKMLRAAPHLIDALLHFLGVAIEKNQLDNRCVENCICLLRISAIECKKWLSQNMILIEAAVAIVSLLTLLEVSAAKSAPSGSPKNKSKLFKRSKKDPVAQPISDPIPNGKSLGAARLWHPETVKIYLRVLQESADSEILEASAAAIQNLAACQFDGSVLVRSTVRTEKGLPILVELLRLKDDKVVCAVVTALRNLALDERNLELIGKYAMKELVSKLPKPDQIERNPQVSDATIGAVLGFCGKQFAIAWT